MGSAIEAWSETYNPAQLTTSHDGYPSLVCCSCSWPISFSSMPLCRCPDPIHQNGLCGHLHPLGGPKPWSPLRRLWRTCFDPGRCFILDMGPRAIDTNQIMSNLLSRVPTWVEFKILLLIGSSLAGHRRGNSTNTRGGGVLDYGFV